MPSLTQSLPTFTGPSARTKVCLRRLAQEQKQQPDDHAAPTTAPAAEVDAVISRIQNVPRGAPAEDTLLSAPQPADRLELLIEDRVAELGERIQRLESRILLLESEKAEPKPRAAERWWIWVLFLVALALLSRFVIGR